MLCTIYTALFHCKWWLYTGYNINFVASNFYILECLIVDIDECEQGTSGCSQSCRNTNGTFICICNEGYQVHDNDPKFCVG